MSNEWASRVDQDIELESWDECEKLLLSSGGNRTIYRGHRLFDWELQTTLERVLLEYARRYYEDRYQMLQSMVVDEDTDVWATGVERRLTKHFRRHAERFQVPNLPEPWDTVGLWEVMQHHLAPTRLMDWTEGPFVGVWFAMDGHQDGDGDMALWVFDRGNANVNHSKSWAALRLMEDSDQIDERRRVNRFVELALTDGNPVLIPVQPRQFARAVAQQSYLTVAPSISTGQPAHWWIRRKVATRIRLREEWKPAMTAACQSMGLTRPGLFRDLDSLGAYITQSFLDALDFEDGIP